MLIAHKIALKPNNKQATYFAKACGVSRFSYNWALAEWQRQYKAHTENPILPKPSQMALRRQLNALKATQFPWMLEVTKNAPQMAIIHLGSAFKNFFEGRASYPNFRKKGVRDRFSITNDQFSVQNKRIRIPNLGWVRMHEKFRFIGKIMSATVSRVANRWFVSITVETSDLSHLRQAENQGAVGVDLGVSTFATLSRGEPPVPGPKPHKVLLQRLRRLSQSLSRKKKGSINYKKAKARLAKLHARLTNIRKDAVHKLTSDLTRRFSAIGIEDLNVRGMVKNRCLARAVSDMGFFEFRSQLEYKATMRGCTVVVADRWFPSTKRCSRCHYVVESLPLSVRTWTCPQCNTVHDRDKNAAQNLEELAVSFMATACGDGGSGRSRKVSVKPPSKKQEVNTGSAPG